MRQVRSHNVTDDSGSPEGCSQPSSPPLCGGVMTGCPMGTSRVPMGHHRTCACAAPPVCRCVGTPQSRARPIRMRRRGNRPWQPGGAYGWRTICRADGLCCVCGRSKTAAVRSVRRAARRWLAGRASIWDGAHTAARTMPTTASGSLQTALPRFTAQDGRWWNRVRHRALARLERYAGTLARVVLRGLGGGNLARLPGGRLGNHRLYPASDRQ